MEDTNGGKKDKVPKVAVELTAGQDIEAGLVGEGRWKSITHGITLDSGSCVDIWFANDVRQFLVHQGHASAKGKPFVAANGSDVPVHGEKLVELLMNEGPRCRWRFTAACGSNMHTHTCIETG